MKTIIYAIAACMGLLHPFATAHAKTTDLQRSSKWQLDYSKDACNLLATHGVGDDAVTLVLTRYDLDQNVHLRLFGKPMRATGQFFPGTVDFGPTANPRKVKIIVGKNQDDFMADYGSVRLDDWEESNEDEEGPAISPLDEAKVDNLTVKIPSGRTLRLQFGSMASPMQAIRACARNLAKSWGYDPAILSALRSPAKPLTKQSTWLKPEDYPSAMLRLLENGIVHIRLDIDETGAVTGCNVINRAGKPDFATATCSQIVKRARYEPAQNANGSPTKSFKVISVRWVTAY